MIIFLGEKFFFLNEIPMFAHIEQNEINNKTNISILRFPS